MTTIDPTTFVCEASWDNCDGENPHRCDRPLDHRDDHECGCQAQAPQCGVEYAPERRDPTARIVRCDLAAGHDGDHEELATEATWPATDRTADPLRCPACGSPQPSMHPAMSGGGEVTSICPHPFHVDPAQPRTPAEALGLDAIEENFRDWDSEGAPGPWSQGLALVAEVRRLREDRGRLATWVRHWTDLADARMRERDEARARVAELEQPDEADRPTGWIGTDTVRNPGLPGRREGGPDTAPATVPLADHPALEWLAIHLLECARDGDGSMQLWSHLAEWLRERQATGLDAVPDATPPAGTEPEHG